MAFNHKYNSDDVLFRAAIIGLVNALNNTITFENVWSDSRRETVRVPFYYAMSGDERFVQDAYDNWNECFPDFIEGNTDPIPRGQISMTGLSVASAELTSRYVRGFYTKEVDGELKRYNSYINSIPIQMNFSAEILCDTNIDAFKITQSIMEKMYRTLVFNINFKGFRVPTQAGFPDNFTNDKLFEYTYGNTERIKVAFDIELMTYLPIIDPDQEFFAGNRIEQFRSTVNTDVSIILPRTTVDNSGGIISIPGIIQGVQGNPGTPGKSAYQIAVDNGFIGTEAEWLESLVTFTSYSALIETSGWQGPGVDGFYYYIYSDSNVITNSFIDASFVNSDYIIVSEANILPTITTSDGSFKIRSIKIPTTDVTLNYTIIK